MGVESFLLSSSLSGLIAQRLVRQLCPACKQPFEADAATRALLRYEDNEIPLLLYRAQGCEQCFGQGYRGRCGVYEIIPVNEALRSLIYARADEQALTCCARGFSTDMLQDGIDKVKAGITSVEELLRVIDAR
jgi:general secretion pathway protein E